MGVVRCSFHGYKTNGLIRTQSLQQRKMGLRTKFLDLMVELVTVHR